MYNNRAYLIHDNISTPLLLIFGYSWTTSWNLVPKDASFRLKVLGSLSTDEQISQLSLEPESGWKTLLG